MKKLKKYLSLGVVVLVSLCTKLEVSAATMDEIDKALEIVGLDNTVIYHCTSTYPSENNELNLNVPSNSPINAFSSSFIVDI